MYLYKILRMGKNELMVENGNVILVDPHMMDINNDMTNAVSQSQDMYIFAELTAISKGRTVVVNGNATSESSKKINFIGNNQNDDVNNPNYLNFTTNYYDGSNPDGQYYEGFGITNIKVVVNSSYVPQVDIQFVDIRGLSFFNQNDSPYRILFDFPPPTFTLTVKGYYGKAITYDLHLVKYTTEFSSANGNFMINAQFVAMTFAPLADILFRYVVNTPLITNRESLNPTANIKPKNTYELILKLKNLYAAISKKMETDIENREYDIINGQIEKMGEIFNGLRNVIKNGNEILSAEGKYFMIAKIPNSRNNGESTEQSEPFTLQKIDNLSTFDEFIKYEETTGISNPFINRLVIAYVLGTNLPVQPDAYTPLINTPEYLKPLNSVFEYSSSNYVGYDKALSVFSDNLLNNVLTSFNIQSTDIGKPTSFINRLNIDSDSPVSSPTKYYGIDITGYYNKLYKKYVVLLKKRDELSLILADKINDMMSENLGMKPSIYNVFEIILNDVDEFFKTLRIVSETAETVHNTPDAIKIIASNNIDSPTSTANVPDHIYPFPLIINVADVFGGTKKERVAPIHLMANTPFPELEFVSKFMDTFPLQKRFSKLYDSRNNQDSDGRYKWIPISPLDSVLGGASPESPYLNINDAISDDIIKILLKRFYILSQGTINNQFYNENETIRNAYITLYANAEAINVMSTLISPENAKNVEIIAKKFANNVDAFYSYASKLTDTYNNGTDIVSGNLYDFPKNNPKYFNVTPSKIYEGKVYVDKNNPEFSGLNWIPKPIISLDIDNENKVVSSNPVDNFNANAKNKYYVHWLKGSPAEYNYYQFTQENVIYLRDITDKNNADNTIFNGVSMFTRYLINYNSNSNYTQSNVIFDMTNSYYPKTQKLAYDNGNVTFKSVEYSDKLALKFGNNITQIWSTCLSNTDVVDVIIDVNKKNIASVLLLSNFGTTMSPFNVYPNQLNDLIFNTPAAVEVPAFYAPYLGMLLSAIKDNWENEILEFFTGNTANIGAILPNKGYYILADLHDVKNYLSENDKRLLMLAYDNFQENISEMVLGVKNMSIFVNENVGANKMFADKYDGYINLLDPTTKPKNQKATTPGTYFHLIEMMMNRRTLVNFSEITFKMSETYSNGYTSIKDLNNNTNPDIKKSNKAFFNAFFNKLAQQIPIEIKKLNDEKKESDKVKGDVDIINQLYYSFKNINDKWLTGNLKNNKLYPFNKPEKRLIDSFAFVDRAMNPIGETMINAEVLVNMLDDTNISLFSVLSQLLSLNNFQFFPLQNFMSFETGGWEDSFKIHTGSVYANTSTAFVCMYIGGGSSYPSVSGNGFENDGIIDISEPGVADYSTKKLTEEEIAELRKIPFELLDENSKQLLSNSAPFQEVRAFRVRFGEQNQSMFTDIKIDSKEYPETNESIQILSRLAGDNNPDAPVPKGQNLYNLYENRSYKATVTGFGNAMIQPTQYFQLENVPLFNGAYIILSVEHNITANKMTTSFSGTKLLKYPIPRVLNPVAFTGLNANLSSGEILISALNIIETKNEAHYTAMYNNTDNSLKID